MKKSIITSLSILAFAIIFVGCGGSGSVSDTSGSTDVGGSNAGGSNSGGSNSGGSVIVSPVVDQAAATVTTPKTPFNLSSKLGTPPGLPQ